MKKITVFMLVALSSAALAKGHNSIHLQHHGRMADIPSHAPVMTRHAAANRNATHVRPLNLNQRGVARITGSIRRLGMASYRFYGQAGQQVRITPIGNNYSMLFGLFDQRRGMNFGTTHVLPMTGEYEVRIVQTRKNAAYNRKSYRYDANVYLGNAAASRMGAVRNNLPSPSVKQKRVTNNFSRYNTTDSYNIAPNTTSDGARRVVSTNTPIQGQRTGKISALPRENTKVREHVITRHVNYSDDPVVSYLKRDQKPSHKNRKVRHKTKSFSTTYQCQSGGKLQVIRNGSAVTVKNKQIAVNLQKNSAQSYGVNQIYTGNGGFLHLINGKKSAKSQVLSFEYKGKKLAVGCK